MDNKFRCIGFRITDSSQLYDMLAQVAKHFEKISGANSVNYFCYTTSEGCQLWCTESQENNWSDCRPHFSGKSRVSLRVVDTQSVSDSGLDGQIVAETVEDVAGMPLVVNIPDYFSTASQIKLTTEAVVQITAFSKQIKVYANDAEFALSPHGKMDPNGSIIPCGTYKSEEESDQLLRPVTILSGRIRSVNCIRNSFSGALFYALEVKTLGGIIDVVIDPESLKKEPKVNGIIVGSFYLSGQIVDMQISLSEEAELAEADPCQKNKEFIQQSYRKYVSSQSFKREAAKEHPVSLPRCLTGGLLLILSIILLASTLFISKEAFPTGLLALVAAVFAAGLLLISSALLKRKKRLKAFYAAEQEFASRAVPITVYGLMVSRMIIEGRIFNAPGLVIGCLGNSINERFMLQLINRIFQLRKEGNEGDGRVFVDQLFDNLGYVKDRRRVIPQSFTGKHSVYVFDLLIKHALLPTNLGEIPTFICMADRDGTNGMIRQVPASIIASCYE